MRGQPCLLFFLELTQYCFTAPDSRSSCRRLAMAIAVLADTRESLARHYLRAGDVRTSEIAYLLGYEDTNSFYRAFKTWTGSTPEVIRAELAGSS